MPTPDWTAGHRAGLAHAWAKGRRIRRDGFAPGADGRPTLGAPERSSDDFLDGWTAGLYARH